MKSTSNPLAELLPDHCGALYIGGEWRNAVDGEQIEVQDPSTESVIATVASASNADGLAALDAAERTQADWADRNPRERSEILRRAFELMTERREAFARLIVREEGKPMKDALGEVAYAAEFFRWYAEEAVRAHGEISRAPGGRNRVVVERRPIGVSVLVTPWNFPAAMGTRKIGPALAAGCSVIWKPASETPLTALALAHLLAEAGVPAGVVNVLPTRGSSGVIDRLLADPRVRKLSFTGSTEVGRKLLAQAAKRIVDCSMELGGNAPLIVFDDADLEIAVAGALIAKMRNTGESCIAANRLYVQSGIASKFTRQFTEAMAALKTGPGLENGVDVGPLVNRDALEKVDAFVAGAVEAGATVLTGGHRLGERGHFYSPTVLGNVPPQAKILCTEIFGPVAPIIEFASEKDAIHLANDTDFGLAAYVFSGDVGRAMRVSQQIQAGIVGINRGFVSDPAAPFGGMKQSGLGREGAKDGIDEFLETQYIAVEW